MKTPFIKRESKEVNQDRVAAAQARRATKIKERKQFWFRLRLAILSIPLAFLLYVLWMTVFRPLPVPFRERQDQRQYLAPSFPSPPAASSQTNVIEIKTEKHTERPAAPPSNFTPPKASNPKGFVESEAEKEYERKNGVEIVHRKDGTTYTRKAQSKNAK